MRLICAAAALLVFAAIPLPALAEVTEDVTVSTTAAYDDMALQSASACLADYAVVREVGEDYVLVALRGDGSGENIQLNVGVMTTLLDNKSGAFAQLADVQVGDNIYVYYSQKKTRSLPPQSNLLLLLTNVGDDAPAHFLTVESFEADTEGTFFLNVDDEGELILTVPEAAWTNSD
jgi:hypothetical protein